MELLSNCGYLSYNSELGELVIFPAVLIATLPQVIQTAFVTLFSQEARDNTGKGLEHLLTNWEVVTRFFYSQGLCRNTILNTKIVSEITVNLLQHYCLDTDLSSHKNYGFCMPQFGEIDYLAASCLVWAPVIEKKTNAAVFKKHPFYVHSEPLDWSLVVKPNSEINDPVGFDYFCRVFSDKTIKLLVVEAKFSMENSKSRVTSKEICKKITNLPNFGKESPLFVLISSRKVTKKPQKHKPKMPVLILDKLWLKKTFSHISPLFISAFGGE